MRDTVAIRATIARRRKSITTGSSATIVDFPDAGIIPGNGSRRLDCEPEEVARQTRQPTQRPDLAAQVNRTEIKELDTVVDEQHHFVVNSRPMCAARGHPDQVAIILEDKGDGLNPRTPVADEGYARARHPLQKIARFNQSDVQRNSLHSDTFKRHSCRAAAANDSRRTSCYSRFGALRRTQ
ncbi:hypothetical protein [Mycobacterium kiyosense]